MSHKGFIPSAATFIRQIRQNLSEGRYAIGHSGFPIIKELVQNADDATATTLHIGISQPPTGLEHPLLQSPGMFVINDGTFQKSDAANIRRFGENTKSMDAAKIGKFGLGLKSIFHLCEAFFFFGQVSQGSAANFLADVLNPWSDQTDSFHPEWDEFSESDQTIVWQSLVKHFGSRDCFCIWIPLRQQSQLNGSEPIIKFFPGDDLPSWLAANELSPEIAKLLPMLEHLNSIHGWKGLGEDAAKEFEVSLGNSSRRKHSFTDLNLREEAPFHGTVSVVRGRGNTEVVVFSGCELNPGDKALIRLEEDKHWPSDLGRDPDTGIATNVREKARQHAGACASYRRYQAGQGRLSISWAVFLPLGEPEVLQLPGVLLDLSLFLHGYFFVDAGRNRPIGLHDRRVDADNLRDDEQLRHSWNQRLADIGTLPLIPRCLSSLADGADAKLSNKELYAVTKALQWSDFFGEFRNQICSRNNWAYVWNTDRSRSWQLLDPQASLFELPECSSKDLPFELFSALDKVVDEHKVTQTGCPRLLNDPVTSAWSADVVTLLLESIAPAGLMTSIDCTHYLCDLLESITDSVPVSARAPICRIVRQGLAQCGFVKPNRLGVPLARLISFIAPDRRLPLDLPEEFSDALIRLVSSQELDIVVVPAELDSTNNPGRARLRPEDLVLVLGCLAEQQKQSSDLAEKEAVAILAAQLINAANAREETLAAVANLPLFIAKDCRSRQDKQVTWNDVVRHRDCKTLFVNPSPNAYSLQKAFDTETVLLISKDCFEAIFPGEPPSQCTRGMIIETLGRRETPILGTPANRLELLKFMIGSRSEPGQSSDYYRAVRYLFHGESAEFDSSSSLLMTTGAQSDIWRRITSVSLGTQQTEWRLLDPVFAPILSGESQDNFTIRQISAESAIPLIVEAGPDAFKDLRPSPTEYATLLKEIVDDNLCKRLAIHQDLRGEFVSIGDDCYWESDISLPPSLERGVTILRRSEDEGIWRRQRDLARCLDSAALIEIVLDSADAASHWQTLADAIVEVPSLPEESLRKLRSLQWLPLRDEGYASPEDIIHLPRISDEVARLTAQFPGIFYEPGILREEIQNHPSWVKISHQLIPGQKSALTMLGVLLLEDQQNHVGSLCTAVFDDWREVASGISDDLLPCGELIGHASSHYPSSTRRIFEQLSKPDITPERIQDFLDHFQLRHQKEKAARRRVHLVAVFNDYLRLKVEAHGYGSALTDQQLPNSLGGWSLASDLCCQNDGVDPSSVVDQTTEEVLSSSMPSSLKSAGLNSSFGGLDDGQEPDWSTIQPEIDAAGHRIRDYFEPWRDIVPNEQIGGFLGLLGDDPEIRKCAEEYLGKNRTLDETRIKFGIPDWKDKTGALVEDALTLISKQRVIVQAVADKSVEVLSLMGVPIHVPRNESPKSIFVSYGKRNYPFPHTVIDSKRILCFRLNVIDPRRQTESDLVRLLRDSAVQFIVHAYNHYEYQTSFGAAWDELSESDQLDISIAQERIIKHGFLILDQLGLRGDPQVAAILDRWDAADRLLAEQRSGAEQSTVSSRRNPDVELRAAKTALREVLENDRSVQVRILAAIKQRVSEHYQYTQAAVPFEIFQNADDASLEFAKHWDLTDAEIEASQTFHVVSSENCLTLAHFGRRINQYPLESRDTTMGFDNDLWKMLVLSLSNKVHSEDDGRAAVTGKFGLGFKSSYLISHRPQLLSGRLAFEVTGAMYPRRLIADERLDLDAFRKDKLDGNAQSTIIQLPLATATSSEILWDFTRLAHLAVVFARQIRCCVLNAGEAEATWDPKPLTRVEGGRVGKLSTLKSNSEPQATQGLLFESAHGSVLFAIGARSIVYFDDDVPSIWVTAPTREFLDLGFLINGPFALDVGRAQLAREYEQNKELATRLGITIGEQLCQLFQAAGSQEGWNSLREELRLAGDASPYDFWDSLFSLLGTGFAGRVQQDTPADNLVREVFWTDTDRGAARLYQSCQAVPSRIRGAYQQLVSISQIRYAVSGLLSDDPKVFSAISQWEAFQKNAGPGAVVSFAHVFEPLKQLTSKSEVSVSHIGSLSIPTVLDWEFKYGEFAIPEIAARMGEVLTKKALELMSDTEYHATREILNAVQFKGRDNQFHPARELLIGHETELERDDRRDDERFRAEFAPDAHVLSEEYGGPGIAFFDVCRDSLEAPARIMAEWVIQASEISQQRAALEYLARGQLSDALLNELRRRGFEGTWLADLASSAAFRALDESTRNRLFDLLPRDSRPRTDWDAFFGEASPQHSSDPETVLTGLYEWWAKNRDKPQKQFQGRTYLEEYTRRTYPSGTPTFLTAESFSDEEQRRTEWTTLFLLALMHTIGRARPGQHREFIAKCEDEGWLELFASSETDSERWMSFVGDYLERQIEEAEYFHWMRQFVGIFQMSRYLDDYIELFLAIDRTDRPFQLVKLLHSRSSSLFQGGGVSVPPLSRVLGLGSCFVVRELVRLGVLESEHAIDHCFVPVKRVRDVFQRLGCDGLDLQVQRWAMSSYLYRFVADHLGADRATFMNDFDIPFQFVAEDNDLCHRFFHLGALDDESEDEMIDDDLVF
ncbi:sacsin N-terminal ATP-binding-like domain-containing protein [Gimesia maris]|uniref:sacsin N-terminal ATP-binding-like domain-containing protein n=1 Tax=Gimesia maris TaxID=122 RepID=UPI00241F20C0|nr:hypothetical protein [Gimesia maris]|tara:strand:+ start:10638 stop:18341 length:7704 start_codon:yes stop_codon:yes gene_type:complete